MTGPDPLLSVKVAVVRVEASIGSEKVAESAALIATPIAPPAGLVELTVGGVVSGAVPAVGGVVSDGTVPGSSFKSMQPLITAINTNKRRTCRANPTDFQFKLAVIRSTPLLFG